MFAVSISEKLGLPPFVSGPVEREEPVREGYTSVLFFDSLEEAVAEYQWQLSSALLPLLSEYAESEFEF